MKSGGGNVFIRAVQRKGLGSEIDQNLIEKINTPFYFKPLTLDLAHGYEADVLVDVCKAVVRAHDAGKVNTTFHVLRYTTLGGVVTIKAGGFSFPLTL